MTWPSVSAPDAATLDRVIDAPARSCMIYTFGSGGVSSWMVEVFVPSLIGNNAEVMKAARIAADYGATTVALTVRDTPLVKAVASPND